MSITKCFTPCLYLWRRWFGG